MTGRNRLVASTSDPITDSHYATSATANVRMFYVVCEEVLHAGGPRPEQPLLKAAAAAVIQNPYSGAFSDDLQQLIEYGSYLGDELGRRAVAALAGTSVQSYGKGAVVGVNGEQEHAVACLTSLFGDALRERVGGGKAWISSVTKVGGPGCSVDVPLAYKDELWIRSHYDAITVAVPGAPLPDEIVVWAAVASGGRPYPRVGGKSLNT